MARPRAGTGKKPNILIIWGDDIGWFNPSCYSSGIMGYQTPHIDRIANEGARFTDWYGQQSCTAGRAAFITGQAPIRTGLTKVGLPGAKLGLDAEVIDLRTLVPLDIETIEQSVEKTGRCLIAQEAPRTSGFAAELSALVQERCFYHLEAPVERVTGWDTPYPHAFEWSYFPGPKRMKKALEKVMAD